MPLCLVGKLEGEGQWVSNTGAATEVHQTLLEHWGSWRASSEQNGNYLMWIPNVSVPTYVTLTAHTGIFSQDSVPGLCQFAGPHADFLSFYSLHLDIHIFHTFLLLLSFPVKSSEFHCFG